MELQKLAVAIASCKELALAIGSCKEIEEKRLWARSSFHMYYCFGKTWLVSRLQTRVAFERLWMRRAAVSEKRTWLRRGGAWHSVAGGLKWASNDFTSAPGQLVLSRHLCHSCESLCQSGNAHTPVNIAFCKVTMYISPWKSRGQKVNWSFHLPLE